MGLNLNLMQILYVAGCVSMVTGFSCYVGTMDTGGYDEHDTGSVLSRKCNDLYSAGVGNGNETWGRCYTASRRQLTVLGCGDCPHKPENATWHWQWKCSTCNTTECNVVESASAAAGRPEIFTGMWGLLGLAVSRVLAFCY
ncbi:hypothetical protein ACHWQZ_G018041 [Mnemiopsis leidyi]